MTDAILTLNAGSSSLKLALFRRADLRVILRGGIDRLGPGMGLRLGDLGTAAVPPDLTAEGLMAWVVGQITARLPELRIVAGGHRVVHGGREFDAPCRVTPEVRAALAALAPLAPLHQPHNLAGIDALSAVLPDIPQIAAFDTAFHRSQPRIAQIFPLPQGFADEGILRYGFHGLSYAWIAGVLPDHLGPRADGRVIVAHLGQGASLCALAGRRSVASTMGFTALDGLMMGRRSGAIDPGLVLHLIRARGMTAEAVEDLLLRRSGLLGVSGESEDMRDLLASRSAAAQEAVALFCRSVQMGIGAMAAVLGGVDAIVFTAGIGSQSAPVRADIAAGLGWLGAEMDHAANALHGPRFDAPGSRVALLCLPTDEETVIARGVASVLDA